MKDLNWIECNLPWRGLFPNYSVELLGLGVEYSLASKEQKKNYLVRHGPNDMQ